MNPPGWKPDPATLEWAAGQVLAAGPATPDTTPLYCAEHYVRQAANRLRNHAAFLRELATDVETTGP